MCAPNQLIQPQSNDGRLTRDQVRQILAELVSWTLITRRIAGDVAGRFGTSRSTIQKIAREADLRLRTDRTEMPQKLDQPPPVSADAVETVYERYVADEHSERRRRRLNHNAVALAFVAIWIAVFIW